MARLRNGRLQSPGGESIHRLPAAATAGCRLPSPPPIRLRSAAMHHEPLRCFPPAPPMIRNSSSRGNAYSSLCVVVLIVWISGEKVGGCFPPPPTRVRRGRRRPGLPRRPRAPPPPPPPPPPDRARRAKARSLNDPARSCTEAAVPPPLRYPRRRRRDILAAAAAMSSPPPPPRYPRRRRRCYILAAAAAISSPPLISSVAPVARGGGTAVITAWGEPDGRRGGRGAVTARSRPFNTGAPCACKMAAPQPRPATPVGPTATENAPS
jgi:hypothetical protein